jgi:hypothetical protein
MAAGEWLPWLVGLGWLVSLSRFMKIFNFNKRMGVGSVFSNIKCLMLWPYLDGKWGSGNPMLRQAYMGGGGGGTQYM